MTARKPRKAVKTITAAAKRITGRRVKRPTSGMDWATEAWYYFSTCGELHYVTTTVANALSQVELYPARRTEEGWERIDDDNDPAVIALDALAGDSPTGMAEMLRRFGQNLFLAGDAYLIGHPAEDERDGDSPTVAQFVDRLAPVDEAPGIDLQSLCWKVYSAREVTQKDSVLKVAGREFDENECVVVRVWRPHPADVHAADSPVRAVLPLLRELEALTKLISAQADSTLAGNGVFVVPDAVSVLGGTAPEDSPDVDPFIVDLMDAMMTPISNRDAASSLVPLVITLPDEMPWQPFHISFARPLDSAAMDMRTELIRRLALGLDAPPEVLMGNGASNHWSAWQIAEDFVKLHIMPVIGLIRDALVREYLRPVLEANGIMNPQDYTIEADASALTLRPNRSAEALQLNAAGLITDAAAREALGFGEEDAPEESARMDDAIMLALDMLKQAPSLAQDPGLPVLVAQIRDAMAGRVIEAAPEPVEPMIEEPEAEIPTVVDPGPPAGEGEAAA
jgi:hypothetical protein